MAESIVRAEVKVDRPQASCPDQEAVGGHAGVTILELMAGAEHVQAQLVVGRELDRLRDVVLRAGEDNEVGLGLLDEVPEVEDRPGSQKDAHAVIPEKNREIGSLEDFLCFTIDSK